MINIKKALEGILSEVGFIFIFIFILYGINLLMLR
jgi:hypothetical protein